MSEGFSGLIIDRSKCHMLVVCDVSEDNTGGKAEVHARIADCAHHLHCVRMSTTEGKMVVANVVDRADAGEIGLDAEMRAELGVALGERAPFEIKNLGWVATFLWVSEDQMRSVEYPRWWRFLFFILSMLDLEAISSFGWRQRKRTKRKPPG